MKKNLKNFSFFVIFTLLISLILSTPLLAAEHAISKTMWQNFLFRGICFLILFGIIWYFAGKKIVAFFNNRQDTIKITLNSLEEQVAKYEKEASELNNTLAEIKNKREEIIKQYQIDAEKERDMIIAEANRTAGEIVEKAKTSLQQELNTSKQQLVSEVGKLTATLAKETITKVINDKDQDKLTEEFIKEISKLKQLN